MTVHEIQLKLKPNWTVNKNVLILTYFSEYFSSYLTPSVPLVSALLLLSCVEISVVLLTNSIFVLKYVGSKESGFTAHAPPPSPYNLPNVSKLYFVKMSDKLKTQFSRHLFFYHSWHNFVYGVKNSNFFKM